MEGANPFQEVGGDGQFQCCSASRPPTRGGHRELDLPRE